MDKFEKWFEVRGFSLFLLGVVVLFCFVPYLALLSLEYTGDGFHIYSSIRNSIRGAGFFYEGPTFGYLLGTHSYLTLLLLFPLVQIFQSPLLLAYVTPFCHILGTWLFYRILCQVDKERTARTPIGFLSILYFFYPSAFFMMGTYYLFLPDQILEPLILLIFYFFLKESPRTSLFFGFLMILLKEEYIPLYPLLFLFLIFCFYRKGESLLKGHWRRQIVEAVAVTLVCTTLSLLTLKYFRNLNSFGAGLRSLEWRLSSPFWQTVGDIFFLIKPAFFVLLFVVIKRIGQYGKAAFSVLIFVGYRVVIDIFTLQMIPAYKWSNAMLGPTIFLPIGFFIIPGFKKASLKDKRLFCAIVLMSFFICLPDVRHTGTHGLIAQSVRNFGPWNQEEARELKEIRSKMPAAQGYEYFIAPEYKVAPFMDRSHVSLSYVMDKTDPRITSRRRVLFREARYVLLPKLNDKTPASLGIPEAKKMAEETHHLVWKTEHYELFGKTGQE